MTAPWSIALDSHLDLIRAWRSPEGPKMCALQALRHDPEIQSLLHGYADGNAEQRTQIGQVIEDRYRGLSDAIAESLDTAATYWVAGDIGRLIGAAAPALPDFRLDRRDVPCPRGYAVLDEFLPLAKLADFPDLPQEALSAVQWESDEERALVSIYVAVPDEQSTAQQPLGSFVWPYGEVPAVDEPHRIAELAKIVLTFWRLSEQRIARTSAMQPARSTRRRAARAGFRLEPDGIRVVTLRRTTAAGTCDRAEAGVDWSHRWIVGGHWRNQWYPSLDDHRPVWIAPHIKGPESAPLVVKDRVYRFTR